MKAETCRTVSPSKVLQG